MSRLLSVVHHRLAVFACIFVGAALAPRAAHAQTCPYVPGGSAGNPDANSCTTGEICLPTAQAWYANTNNCNTVAGATVQAQAAGVKLSWTNPSPAPTAVRIFRTNVGVIVTNPTTTAVQQYKIFDGTGTSYTDATAPSGVLLQYTVFTMYSGGWSKSLSFQLQRDDADSDGMSDGWEISFGLDAYNPGDAGLDNDGDALSNLAEFVYGSNPLVADTDGDGLKDGYEVAHGSDPTLQDTDGDGMSDAFEPGIGLDVNNGHDFIMGNYSSSANNRIGAYIFDSGEYKVGADGQSAYKSATNQLVISSFISESPVGAAGAPDGHVYAGYLYTIEEFLAPNFPPSCDAGLDQTITLPGTVALSGSGSDPNGDPVSFSWKFVGTPPTSSLTDAAIVNKTTASPSFTPDVFGYYMLELSCNDITGNFSAPSYVIVTAMSDQLFYFSGPFLSESTNYRVIAATHSGGGGLAGAGGNPNADYLLSSATNKLGGVVDDRSPAGGGLSATNDLDSGFLATAFALYSFTQNVAPTADAGNDQTVVFSSVITLDGTGSFDPDSFPAALTYQWSFWQKPYGSNAILSGSTSATASFTPDKAGSYVLTLKVFDGEIWSVPTAVVINVSNSAPIANAGIDQKVNLSSPAPVVALSGAGSFDPEGSTLQYIWRIYRKPDGSTSTLSSTTTVATSFTPDVAGYYTLELVVKDGLLVSAPDYVLVTVASSAGQLPPLVAIGPSQSLVGVNTTGLDGSGSSDPDWNSTAYPDPDSRGYYRKGIQRYDWAIVTKPSGSTAAITCPNNGKTGWTVPSPVYNCPNPQLAFNGFNGTYVLSLRVTDYQGLNSDTLQMTVSVSGIVNVPPVAQVSPAFKTVDLSNPTQASVYLSGAASFDPVDAAATLTYTWTVLSKPSGSTAAIAGSGATPTLQPIDKQGQYRVHLKVCDQTGKCSCGPTESRPNDAYCNKGNTTVVSTTTDIVSVAMPTGWPVAGAAGGSGGGMYLEMSADGIYDKPVVYSPGFSALNDMLVSLAGDGPEANHETVVLNRLKALGYDVWYLAYTPVCSGSTQINLTSGIPAWGGKEACPTAAACACPYPELPVDNHMSLNAVVMAQAIKYAKSYGACGAKSADSLTDPCFVRVVAHSMGGVIARYALAFAEDPSKVTVPYAKNETAPYALNGLRAKPTGVSDWDLGARVLLTNDTPHLGANVPKSLAGLLKVSEAGGSDAFGAGGALSKVVFMTSGIGNMFAWGWSQFKGFRDTMVGFRDPNSSDPLDLTWLPGGAGMNTLTDLQIAWQIFKEWDKINSVKDATTVAQGTIADGAGGVPGATAFSIGVSAVFGFMEGLVAGIEWAIIGAVVSGAYTYLKWQAYAAIMTAIPGWGVVIVAVLEVLDYFLGIGSFFFSVKTKFVTEVLPDSQTSLTPIPLSPVVTSRAAAEMLYEQVTTAPPCPDAPIILQGNSVSNTRKTGFGKDKYGKLCRGTMNVGTSSTTHDNFYNHLGSLANAGWPTRTRNNATSFGATYSDVKSTAVAMEIYLPYMMANQRYPLTARDRKPGSFVADVIEHHLVAWKLGLKGVLYIKKKVLGFSSTKKKLLFSDYVRFYDVEDKWPFVPTESALDLERNSLDCSANLPCCQLMPSGATKLVGTTCCLCTTGQDASFVSRINQHHTPLIGVNVCDAAASGEHPVITKERTACVATGGQGIEMCSGSATKYLDKTPNGTLCMSAGAFESETVAFFEVINRGLTQLDARPGDAAYKAFRCFDGATSCGTTEGEWIWIGGDDFDADGCPQPACETAAQDLDSNVQGNLTGGNQSPTITAISAQQTFQLPTCYRSAGGYMCRVEDADTNGNPLTLSVTATDPEGDPLNYTWEFIDFTPAGNAGAQSDKDARVMFSAATARQPEVAVIANNQPPQGTYRVRVIVKDNKNGVAVKETSVVVPGDAPPSVVASGPTSVNEICDYNPGDPGGEIYVCYANLEVFGSATDPDGPDSTSILMVVWEDLTEAAEVSGYSAARVLDDPYVMNPGLEVYASSDATYVHASTPQGYPLKFRMTAIDIRGQQASAEVSVKVCLTAGGC